MLIYRATILQHETTNTGRGSVEAVSVAIPAVMRAGGDGKMPFNYLSLNGKAKLKVILSQERLN